MKRSSPEIPTFSVRFESPDDFLIAYTDRLRHGALCLPLPREVRHGSAVRLRLTLPDGAILYLAGRVGAMAAEEGTRIVGLQPLNAGQREQLQRCALDMLGDPEPRTESSDLDPTEMNLVVVDDSVSYRLELSNVLRSRGVRVRVAENGLLGLAAALKRRPHAILTDVQMPHMDGWALLRAVRGRPRLHDVAVVFLTRHPDEALRLEGYRCGVDECVAKSVSHDELIARVLGAVERRRQLDRARPRAGLRGRLSDVRLGSLLSFLESERSSGALALRSGGDRAVLHLRRGRLSRVEHLGACEHPNDRVFELLGWGRGEFEFRIATPGEVEVEIEPVEEATPLSYLVIEHARRTDEAAAT